MHEEKFNMSMRRFLKKVGVSSQQKIEHAVQQSGKMNGKIPVKMVLTIPELGVSHTVEDEIELD
jgi:Family of unknown function (DUF6494)